MRKGIQATELLGLLLIAGVVCLIVGGCVVKLSGGAGENYSTGTRTGTLYKCSKKGVVWESWEGELLLNEFQMSKGGQETGNVWSFSTRDDEVGRKVESLIGKKVNIKYRQYFIGPIQQSSDYTVIDVEAVE